MNRWIPTLAAVVATVGDLMMLRFVADGAAGGQPLVAWAVVGGVLGVVAIPLYGLGYRLIVPTLRRWHEGGARVVALFGPAIGVVGAVIHALTAWALVVSARNGMPPVDALQAAASWGAPYLTLWGLATTLTVVASVVVAWGSLRLGIWPLVLATPAFVTLVLGTVGLASEGGRAYILPAAPNLGHVVFFAVAAFASTRRLGRRASRLNVALATTDAQILACYGVMVQLRPHVKLDEFVTRVRSMEPQGYRLAFVREAGHVIAVAGFRPMDTLAWGRVLYVDDLVTDETWRSRGVGHRLFDWLIAYAREAGLGELHLDSGVQRLDAHRFYEREGLRHVANHFRIRLDGASE